MGSGCLAYSKIYQRPRGMFLSIGDAGRVESILRNWPKKRVQVIVVTDGKKQTLIEQFTTH